MLFVVSYRVNYMKLMEEDDNYSNDGMACNQFLALLKSGIIEEVRLYDTRVYKHRVYDNSSVIRLIKDGKIVNAALNTDWDNKLMCIAGDECIGIPSLIDLKIPKDSSSDRLLSIVGISCDNKYVIGVTPGQYHRFISIQDIKYRIFGVDNKILLKCRGQYKNTAEDVTDRLVKVELSRSERLRLLEIDTKNKVLSVIGNSGMRWASDGSLCLNKGIRHLSVSELDYLSMCTTRDNLEFLETLTIKHGRLKIPDRLFVRCLQLEQLHLPDELVDIGANNFTCTKLKELDLRNCVNLESIGGSSISANLMLERLCLPDNCKKLSWGACCNNPNLKELILPKSLDDFNIGELLYKCSQLERLVLPDVKIEFRGNRKNHLPKLKEIVTSRVNLGIAKSLADGRDITRIKG